MDEGVSAAFVLGILTCPVYRVHRQLQGDGKEHGARSVTQGLE